MRGAVRAPWQPVLAREHWWRSVFMSGFARRRGSHILRSGEHRAFGAPMNQNCTLWTLWIAWFESVFFASFLCRFGQMTCRHAQWLIVIKRISDSRRPPRPKAPPQHQPRPLTREPGNRALPPTATPGALAPEPPAPRPQHQPPAPKDPTQTLSANTLRTAIGRQPSPPRSPGENLPESA